MTLFLNAVVMDLKHSSSARFRKAEQRYFMKLRKVLKFKEAIKITLNVINLVALQCVKFKIKIKKLLFCTVLHGMEQTMT